MRGILLTAQQARDIDKFAEEKLGILPLVLMENAGRAVAEEVKGFVHNQKKRIVIFCGKGNNAGDGFTAARHLIAAGYNVDVYILEPIDKIKNEAEINLNILKKISRRIFKINSVEDLNSIHFKDYVVIVDALLGIGLKGEIQGLLREIIAVINESDIPVLSVDIPSGLNATSGKIHGIAVCADVTVTFFAKKQGVLLKQGPEFSGRVIVKDLGIPIE